MATLFLRNPHLTLLTIGLIVVAGLSSFVVLPRMEDPLLTERAALVLTSLPGADADQVESLITEPIEDEFRDISEIKEVRSSSRASFSTITVELRDDVYADKAPAIWSRIRDRIADAEARLPPNASKPRFECIEVTAYSRLIALMWDDLGRSEKSIDSDDALQMQAIVKRHAEELREKLLAVPGTKNVDVLGQPSEEITVEVRPQELTSLGLTAVDVSRVIAASDSRFSAGFLRGEQSDLLIELSGKLTSIDHIAAIPVKTSPEGHVVSLGDIADIRRGIREPVSEMALVEGKRAIVLACLVRPGERIDWWSVASKSVTDTFASTLPRGIRMVEVFSQDGYVTDRLMSLMFNLLIGAVSVMTVILWLMGWRSAVVVGVALPLSAFMVLTGMRLMDVPVHQMSVTGLIIALGLLIDNAIVIVDEVSRKLRDNCPAHVAVADTVHHLAVPLFGSTFTTALAFAPIAVMPGPAGEFVGAIAINVVVAIFGSLFLAMTIVPAMTGFLGRFGASLADTAGGEMPSPEPVLSSRGWYRDGWSSDWLRRKYKAVLQLVTRYPLVGVGFGMALPLAGFVQARLLPEQFFPPADRDQIAIEVDLSPQASLQETMRLTRQLRENLLRRGDVEEVTWWLGRSAPPFYYNQIPWRRSQSQYAQALVKLHSTVDLPRRINAMQEDLDVAFPQARVLVRQLEQGPPFKAPIEVEVFGPDPDRLKEVSNQISRVLAAIPDVTHVRAEVSEPQPRLTLRVDEEEARLAGLTHESIALQMNAALEGTLGGLVLEGTEEIPVRVRVANELRGNVHQIESLDLLSPKAGGDAGYSGIPLSAVATTQLTSAQAAITREDRRRMTEVQAFLKAGVLPAEALAEFKRRFAESGVSLPPGYQLGFGGEVAQRNDAVANLMASVGVLAVLMVAALVLSFRSFRIAALVGVVAVLAVGLGLGALWVFGFPFGFMAIIGTMGLVGVAINDTIVVLAAIRQDDAACHGDRSAVVDVLLRATRHVVATSLTTMAGFLPLILGGGNFWPPLGVTIAGGVGGATILALIFVPACYLLAVKEKETVVLSDV